MQWVNEIKAGIANESAKTQLQARIAAGKLVGMSFKAWPA